MAKDERNIYTIQNDAGKGEVKIADEVVATLQPWQLQKWRRSLHGGQYHE